MAVPQPQSRNPFLSPQSTGTSLRPASVAGPSLHSAFQDLSLAPPPTQQQPLTPQPTAASTASNNPFLDRHTPTRPLDDAELRELEGTTVPAADEGAQATPQQPALGGPSPLVKTAPAPVASSSTSSGVAGTSSRRVAEGNEDFRGASFTLWAHPCSTRLTLTFRLISLVRPDDDEALRAAIEASLADGPPETTSTFSPPPVVSSKAAEAAPPLPPRDNTAYAPPPGPPPLPSTSRPSTSPPAPPVDPPPAYTPSSQNQESTVDVGPRYSPFATQAPMEPQRTGWSEGGGNPGGFLEPGDPGYRPLGGGGGGGFPGGHNSLRPSQGFHHTPQPPLPPRHPSASSGHSYNPSPHPPPHHTPSSQLDPTPSSVPIIGRPFLNHGQTLVYPPAFTCWKCQNTGWKDNDPTHPCRQCWKRYGRPFSGPLTMAWNPPPANYQRPLAGPHRPMYPVGGWAGPDPGIYRPAVNHPPPGSVVYRPGDPRIGGALCMKCGGAGVTIGFFEDDTCSRCGGVGRVF